MQKIGLSSDNCIVIGSGILQVLGIRQSKDIDVVVTKDVYDQLKNSGKFKSAKNEEREVLVNGICEIGSYWEVLGKSYKFENLCPESTTINGVRYITLEFLYKVKQSWVKNDSEVRQKDVDDIKLIKDYFNNL